MEYVCVVLRLVWRNRPFTFYRGRLRQTTIRLPSLRRCTWCWLGPQLWIVVPMHIIANTTVDPVNFTALIFHCVLVLLPFYSHSLCTLMTCEVIIIHRKIKVPVKINWIQVASSLVPSPFSRGKEKGLVSTVCTRTRFVREFEMNIFNFFSDVQTWVETLNVMCFVQLNILPHLPSACSPSRKIDTGNTYSFHGTLLGDTSRL